MAIPIQNIYYLLCYSWNKLDEKDLVNVQEEDTTELIDLFAKVLINGTTYLLKRGLDRYYVEENEDFRGIKGKLNLDQSIKRNLFIQRKTHCSFDEFSHNILHNQILRTTIYKLIRAEDLDEDLKESLRQLLWKLSDIDLIEISSSTFTKVKLNRNNYFYDFLLNICQIIHESIFINEATGNYKFRDFLRDEKKMAYVFEEFVRNFYDIELDNNYKVRREDIKWQLIPDNEEAKNFLPKMQTDITIESKDQKFIIDTKYYKSTLQEHTNYDVKKIHSNNLYQLFAYLKNTEHRSKLDNNCIGMLLYPTVDKEVELDYRQNNQRVLIRTINLNKHWKDIRDDLLKMMIV